MQLPADCAAIGRNRKADVECGALTLFAVEVYLAIVELNGSECLCQPDAGPALLCRVVEVEYAIPGFRAYPDAMIGDDYVGGPVMIHQGRHFQGSALGHCLASIYNNVE